MTNNYPLTLQQLLYQSVEQYGMRNALAFVDGEKITYNEFYSRIYDLQKLLIEKDIQPGDRVALLAHNSPSWGIAYFAIAAMGAAVVPLMPDFSEHELETILTHAECKAVFVSVRLSEKLAKTDSNLFEHTIILDDLQFSGATPPSFAAANGYNCQPEDILSIIYTSGTTGKSKGVMLSHKNLMSQLGMARNVQPVQKDDVFLSILPLSHTYENSLGFLLPLFCGASVNYLDKLPTPSVLLPALQTVRPTYLLTVPMIIEKIFYGTVLPQLRKTALTRILYAIPFMRKLMHKKAASILYEKFGGRLVFFGVGGAKLNARTEQFLKEGRKIPYAIGYGLTETAPLISAAVAHSDHFQSAGFPLEEVQMRINNPRNGEGEIWVKGENVMTGYYKDPEATAEVMTDGWFHTGDLGKFDRTGRIHIIGRLKNMIVGPNGENIYPEEIENLINSYSGVLESLVVERKGRLVAMVHVNLEEWEKQYAAMKAEWVQIKQELKQFIEEKKEEMRQELILYVNERVRSFSRLYMVELIAVEFEKTSTKKIKRYLYK
ncbi:MAG: AMP-binding protein [Bacteroidales bacterium]|nr:AMP-binding protein [Bacteroidales bacterium]MCL2133811.1 AMP-binding protein [Bacteroidales bacterium]